MPCGPSPPPCLNMQWGVPLEFVETDTHKHPHAEILKNDGSQGELRWYTIWGMCHNRRGPSKQKNIKNRRQNQVKIDLKSLKMTFGGVWSGLGGRLGAMLAPRGAQEPQHVRKPRSRSPRGPPFGWPFSVFFMIFRCFFACLFRGLFWRASGSNLEVILGRFSKKFQRFFGQFPAYLAHGKPSFLYGIYSVWGTSAFKKTLHKS